MADTKDVDAGDDEEYIVIEDDEDEDRAQMPDSFGAGASYGDLSKPRLSNTLPLWGDAKTMNLNDLVLKNVLNSAYFKFTLVNLKTLQEVIPEILHQVKHIEPWEMGTRRQTANWGMCGGVRGVAAGGVTSSAFCILYKLFNLRLTRNQLTTLIEYPESSFVRALGFMYIRYTQPPQDFPYWFDGYWDDQEELEVKAGGGQVMKIGELIRSWVTKNEWCGTHFPRIPIPLQKKLNDIIAEYEQTYPEPNERVHRPPIESRRRSPPRPDRSYRDRRRPSPERRRNRSRSPLRHERRRRRSRTPDMMPSLPKLAPIHEHKVSSEDRADFEILNKAALRRQAEDSTRVGIGRPTTKRKVPTISFI